MQDTVVRFHAGDPHLNYTIQEINIPTVHYREEHEKTTNKKPVLQMHQLRNQGETSKKESVQGKPQDAVDDGCVFSRVRSWKSTDVKVS